MNEIPKIDECKACGRGVLWAWVPAVVVDGKPLAGTGEWQSQVEDGRCVDCDAELKARRRRAHEDSLLRVKLVQLLGPKPYREFSFENYKVMLGNENAFERCKRFNPGTENLYLWGGCGTGKTHLAFATARRYVEATLSVAVLSAYRLSRQARMNDSKLEQASLNEWVSVNVLILDHLGADLDTTESRTLLKEIIDCRDFQGRAGLVVTSIHSPDALAQRTGDDAIASRLAGMCEVLKLDAPDYRLNRRHAGM